MYNPEKHGTFAKLFEDERYGQILVLLDSDKHNVPRVSFYAQPPNLGVCHAEFGYLNDDDDSWDKAEKAFNETTIERALQNAKIIFDSIGANEY